MTIEELHTHKKIYLLGYGIEGQATERFFKKICPEIEIGIGDQKLDPDYVEKQKDYDLIIRSPGVPLKLVKGPYTTATDIFFANAPFKTIGVTGTKGKSTTVSLIHQLLIHTGIKAYVAGNIGKAMLDLLTEENEPDACAVLELSSYQLEDIHYSPHISCVLNVYEELHNHPDFDSYRKAKYAIAARATPDDILIYNPALPALEELLSHTQAKNIPFIEDISSFHFSPILSQDTVKALATIGLVLNIKNEFIQQTLDVYQPLPHRLQKIGTFQSITFINDSAANHPQATLHALHATPNVATILLGGQDRDFNFSEVVKELAQENVKNIVLFPNTEEKIMTLLSQYPAYTPHIQHTHSMEEAVQCAFKNTPQGSICLLSPGAPSYLMFSGFPARAEAFINAIHHYAQENSS